ncbi:MAG TPA: VIT1/CCC1 transporter family protein [Chloroflexota bacterium]|jgi:VIT1/CCC1 family predicted Fe2+/Mn2+ transporter
MIRSLAARQSLFASLALPTWLSVPRRVTDRRFVLQVVQPALAGFMDGSVSTLAPLFATALATRDAHTTFMVGLAAAVGAGISMAFAEALSDDGSITGRGNPWLRGLVEGLATLLGGLGHALPFLLPDVHSALVVACCVVALELLVIALVRFHYFHMPLSRSMLQVVAGGALVFTTGVVLGSA